MIQNKAAAEMLKSMPLWGISVFGSDSSFTEKILLNGENREKKSGQQTINQPTTLTDGSI